MADNKFDLVFNASLEVGQVKAAVASLTKSLESAGAKIPQSMTTNLNRMIQSLSTELNKLEGMTDIELDPKNAKNVGKSYEKIFQTFQQIKAALSDINRTAGIDPEKFFPSEIASNIAKAAQAVQKYKKTMEAGVKTDEYTQTSKDIAKANKETEDLQKKLNEAIRKRDEASNTKQALQNQRAELQAKKDTAEAEVKAAKDSEKVIKDKIESQKKLAQIEADIAKKKKTQQAAVDKAAKANEVKNERESMKQAKGKGTDTKIYREAVASYAESTAEVQKLQSEIDQLEAEFTQLSQSATVSNDDLVAATEKVTKATEELSSAQKSLNKNQAAMDTEDTRYAAAIGEIQTLTPEVQKAEQALEQLRLKKQQLEANFEQATFNELIQELEKLGVKLPDTERSMEGVERALESMASQARGEVASALNGIKEAAEDIEKPMSEIGRKADDVGELGEQARRAEQDMENLKNQVFDFFSITNTIQIFKNAIRDAFDTVKELDAAMTETAVVTDFSVGDMWDKLPEYSAEATKLGASIKGLYEATTLYYQQGLNSEQAMSVGIETMKMARIANMDAAQATEAMTAALRGFNMEINEISATRINDVYSELAAITAADTSQIATAMTKTASIAKSANMEFETTAALLAQIIETTQEAPETAGTAMKTIIARFTEVKQLFSEGMLTGEDSEGEVININKIDTALKTVGISLKDFLTGAKGIDDIFLELASKWDTLDLATQRYIATTAAGSRQQSRFLAMMSNYDRTMELVNAATNSAGASQKQFGKTLESLDAKLQKLKNAWDTFTMGLANSEIIKGGVDLLTQILETVNKLTEAFDGIGGSVAKIGLAIAALRTGKGLFNLFTGQAYSAGTQAGAKFAAGLAASIENISIDQATSNLQNNLKGALSSTVAWSNGLLALGMGLKFTAQQIEDSPYAEYADEVSMAGTAVLGLTGALKILTPIAAAANTTVLGLIKTVIMGMGPWGLAAAAIIAIGGALAYIGHQNTPGQILKKMKKNAEEAGTAAEEAAQKYNELKTSLDNLSSSEEALNNLTVGTQEWRDAVVNLNDEILKLIETYPELAELVNFKDGHLTIDYDSDRGQEITKQLHSQVIAKQIASIAADASVVRQEEQTYYYDNIYGFNPLVSQIDAIEELANAIYHDYSSFDTQDEIKTWLENNNLKQFADEISVGKLYDNKDRLYDYGKYLEGNQIKYDSYNAVVQSTLISKMSTNDYSDRVIDLLGKIQVPVQDYADNWRENNQINKSDYRQFGKILAEQLYGEGATVSLNKLSNEITLSNKDGTESRTISFDEFKDQVAYYEGSQKAVQQLEEAASLISSMSEKQQDSLDKLISTEGQSIDLTMLKDINLSGGIQQYISSIFGPEVAENFESIFGIGFEQLESNMQIAMERISKERGALVKRMSKYSSKDLEGYEVNSNILAGLELKFGERISNILDGVLSSLEKSGDEALITKGFEQFRETAMAGTKEEMEELSSFIQNIDWSNPIEAAYRLNQEIATGTGLTKEYAQGIVNMGSSFLGASSQMQYLFKTEEYNTIKEEIDEIIEKNGELSAGDVLDLADEYKTLDKILKNTNATAGGLAKTLELVAKGKLGIHQLTDAVMAALEGFDGLNSMVAGVLKTLSEFDPGMNENEIADFINTAYETLSSNLKAGAVGNNQNFSYLDFFFPGWDKGLEGDALIAQMEYLTGKLEDNSVNMRRAWSDMDKGIDIYGEAWQFDEGSGRTAQDLLIDDTGSSIKITGWEGKGMTTQDMVDWIADAYNVSNDYAKMMLGDFKNYSADLAKELNTNDFTAAIENAYSRLRTIEVSDISDNSIVSKKIIDTSEIEALAELYGKKFNEVYAMFDGKALITDFYDDNGFLQETSIILGQLDEIAQSGGVVGARWIDRFIDSSSKNLDITKLNAGLDKIGIPESAKAGITQDIVDSMLAASNGQPVYIDVKMSDGITRAIEVTPEIDVQTAIANAETELTNSNLAEAIASAFKNITFSPKVDGKQVTDSVIAAIKAANGTAVIIAPDQDSLNTIASSIVSAAKESTPVAYVSGNVQAVKNAVASLSLSTECVVTYVEGNSPPGSTNSNKNNRNKEKTGPNAAKGVRNAAYSGATLVSEDGPELIQKAKGGAYLSGTSGPEMVNIERGDTVYTAEETQQIFKKRSHTIFPRYAEGYGYGDAYGSGSGGANASSKSDDDKEDWENSFDKLYNLIREIDEELRRRERLERRYEKLLESVDLTAGKLFDNAVEQLRQLEKEKLLNKELQEARRSQIQQYQQENADLMKYAKVVQNERGEDVLRIHWDQIDLVEDPEQGERIEDYVSQLEEWFDSLEEAEDKLNDIEDRIEEVKELGKEEYLDFENTVKDAITFAYQEEIDKLSQINESINDTNSQLIDAISKQVNRIRQQRENERTEQELREKQRQLLYLSQDTSGANDMAILELRKEIEEGTVDYTDTLIDQKIDELQMQNDEAAEQREQQITLMQGQLDHLIKSGEIWDEVYTLMDEGLDPEAGLIRGSRLEQILKSAENFDGMSKVQQMDWLKELQQQAAQAVVYMRLTTEKIDTAVELNRQNHFGGTTPEPEYNGSSSGGSGGGSGGGGSFGGSSASGGNNEPISTWKIYTPGGSYITTYTGTQSQLDKNFPSISYKREKVPSTGGSNNNGSNNSGSSNNSTSNNENYTRVQVGFYDKDGNLKEKVTYDKNSNWERLASYWAGVYGGEGGYYSIIKKYKTGGLADFTGPAWLDGTKSRPELVLNQKDTQNFIQLKDILASLMTGPQTSTENNGDITYDIDINVESISSDYDVEQVANKIKSLINEDARYRNNNAVSLKR